MVLLLFFSIEKYESLALDVESTHPLENFFGYVRMDAHDINTPDEMTRTITHINIVKEACLMLQLEAGVLTERSKPRFFSSENTWVC
jgi:hypothetical protein